MDAFYASVEIRDNPELRGKPVVVGGSSARGVVAAASYEARRFGVFSAMPMVRAKKACPNLVVVPLRMSAYVSESDKFFEILGRYSPHVEGLSLDEAFIDLTGTERLFGEPDEAIWQLRTAVRTELNLACTAGIAPVKFVAKILSGEAKPDGQRRVLAPELLAFLHPLPVGKLWGVGPKREDELKMLGIRTIGDLTRCHPGTLERRIGKEATDHLMRLARGQDERGVVSDREAKSVGAEETFETDLTDPDALGLHLLSQAERVAWRLRRSGRLASGVTLKYKLSDFRLVTRQRRIPPTAEGGEIYKIARDLLRLNPPGGPVRLIGLNAYDLVDPDAPIRAVVPVSLELDFSGSAPTPIETKAKHERTARLTAALDGIREKHGLDAVMRATLMSMAGRDLAARPGGPDAPKGPPKPPKR